MVSPLGDKCVKKIENCEVNFYEQPMDAFGMLTLSKDEQLNRWICDECKPGFYFNDDQVDQPYCEECMITNCLECELHPDRCELCSGDFIPNYRGDACIEPIAFCATSHVNYDHNGDVWICPECMTGYFPLDDTC